MPSRVARATADPGLPNPRGCRGRRAGCRVDVDPGNLRLRAANARVTPLVGREARPGPTGDDPGMNMGEGDAMTTGHGPLWTRRDLLIKGGASTLALAGFGLTGPTLFAAASSTANRLNIVTPGVEEGPYWVEELLVRSDIRIDPVTGILQPGFPLKLNLFVWQYISDTRLLPLKGAIVDVWHANSLGVYSDEQGEGTLGQKYLRGTQIAAANGNVGFTTIYPGWYSGRTPHVHFRVRVLNPLTNAVAYNFVSMVFFNEAITNNVYSSIYPYNLRPVRDTINATDRVYTGASTDDELTANSGTHLMLNLTGDYRGVTGTFNLVLDLSDAGYNNPTGGGVGGGGPGGPGGAPPGR